MTENLLTQEQAALLLGLKPPTLASWRHQGRGPRYLKIGRSCFYRESDIETWLDGQAVIPPDTARRRYERDGGSA
jgi:predicted DNA-binding transcriptional regulator AlpA